MSKMTYLLGQGCSWRMVLPTAQWWHDVDRHRLLSHPTKSIRVTAAASEKGRRSLFVHTEISEWIQQGSAPIVL